MNPTAFGNVTDARSSQMKGSYAPACGPPNPQRRKPPSNIRRSIDVYVGILPSNRRQVER